MAQATRRAAPAPQPANNNAVGQALEIGPPVFNIKVNPGQVFKTQISVRDIATTKLLVKSQLNDFTAAGEDGSPKVIVDNVDENNPYSIRKWISPLPDLILEPKQIRNLPITINVPAKAAPGGYYGVVRFTATAPGVDGNGVALSASVGSLLLVTVNGVAKQNLDVEEFKVLKDGEAGTLFQNAPLSFMQRIRNTGNIHEQPTGHVTVKDMFGKIVGVTNVNSPPRNVLPGTIRRFEQQFDKTVIGDKKLFGKYTATLEMNYAGQKSVGDELTFWVIPYTLIAIIIILLVVIFFALRFALKRYTQNAIKQSQRGRRR